MKLGLANWPAWHSDSMIILFVVHLWHLHIIGHLLGVILNAAYYFYLLLILGLRSRVEIQASTTWLDPLILI